MDTKEFIRKTIIEDIALMQKSGLHYHSFILMAQSIEFLGAFLDSKPLKAEKQSKKRFNKALMVLFPKKYFYHNKDHKLYNKLRNQMVHALIPSSEILLTTRNSGKKHLEFEERKLILVAEELYEDIKKACERLIEKIDAQEIRNKQIPVDIFIP